MIFNDLDLDIYLKELEYIVNIDTGSDNPAGIEKMANFFIDKYKEIGCITEIFRPAPNRGPCVKIQNKPSDRYDVLMLCHMDTVFPVGTVKKRSFRVEGGYAFGPGVCDMKSGLLSAFYLFKWFSEHSEIDISLCLLMNSDEEIGSMASTPWIKEHAFKSGIAIVFEPGRVDGSFVVERKGTAKYEIEFKGLAAHAGVDPEKGKSAITEMASWMIKLDILNNYDEGVTLNTGIVSGGTAANVVADYAYMKLDVRFKNLNQAQIITDTLNTMSTEPFIEGVEATVRQVSFREPMNPNERTLELLEKLRTIGEKYGIPITLKSTGGVSDGNGVSALGIPVIDGFGPVGGFSHSEKEYTDIESIKLRFRLLLDLILSL